MNEVYCRNNYVTGFAEWCHGVELYSFVRWSVASEGKLYSSGEHSFYKRVLGISWDFILLFRHYICTVHIYLIGFFRLTPLLKFTHVIGSRIVFSFVKYSPYWNVFTWRLHLRAYSVAIIGKMKELWW